MTFSRLVRASHSVASTNESVASHHLRIVEATRLDWSPLSSVTYSDIYGIN